MGLIPDAIPINRTPEDIDRMLSLVRRYWLAHPHLRFELIVDRLVSDYHYNSDAQIETALHSALASITHDE